MKYLMLLLIPAAFSWSCGNGTDSRPEDISPRGDLLLDARGAVQDLRMPEDSGAQVGVDTQDLIQLKDTALDTEPEDLWPDRDFASDGIEAPPTWRGVELLPAGTCGADFQVAPWVSTGGPSGEPGSPDRESPNSSDPDNIEIAHLDPPPASTHRISTGARGELVMPDYNDDLPLFPRGTSWDGGTRCYELPLGAVYLSEAQAWSLYRDLAEAGTGVSVNTAHGVRTVIGLRGAYPGTFTWNGNTPNRFDDTLVLLWVDENGQRRVREYHAHTDTGAYDFGWHNSSSLRPNRRYHYINGWHKTYNALRIDEYGYQVRDDTNKNAHWDSDRNGWLPPEGEDHDRVGSAHNIHTAEIFAPLEDAEVDLVSAGCQVIPGIRNWTEFITTAWTGEGDSLNYFLLDARDLDPTVWAPCEADGSRACPFRIGDLPYSTSASMPDRPSDLDDYPCVQEFTGDPELVWIITPEVSGNLEVQATWKSPAGTLVLLDGDDPRACLAEGADLLSAEISPGRYWLVVEAGADAPAGGMPLLDLNVSLEEF